MASDTSTHQTAASDGAPSNERSNWWIRMLMWREKHLPDRTFVALLALVVGIAFALVFHPEKK